MDPSRVEAVTFDVGGTLIEVFPSVGEVYAQVAAANGFPGISAEVLNHQFATAWKGKGNFDYSLPAWRQLVDATFAGQVDPPPSRTFFSALYQRFEDPAAWRVFGDVGLTFKRLQRSGIKLGIISNWDVRLRPLLTRLGLGVQFQGVTISAEVGCAKPEAAIFRRAADQLGLAPGSILHIGDSLREDVLGARRSGFQAMRLDRTHAKSGHGTLTSLLDLSALLDVAAAPKHKDAK